MIESHQIGTYPNKILRKMKLVDIIDEGSIKFSLPWDPDRYPHLKDPLTIWMFLWDDDGSEMTFQTTLGDILDFDYESCCGDHPSNEPRHLVGPYLENFREIRDALAKELERLNEWVALGDKYAKPNKDLCDND